MGLKIHAEQTMSLLLKRTRSSWGGTDSCCSDNQVDMVDVSYQV
jgi:hypothetical protein